MELSSEASRPHYSICPLVKNCHCGSLEGDLYDSHKADNKGISCTYLFAKLNPVCKDIFIPWAQTFTLLDKMNVYAYFLAP